jgi:cell division cycle 20-like protein 1 (cofactor of APC complex)
MEDRFRNIHDQVSSLTESSGYLDNVFFSQDRSFPTSASAPSTPHREAQPRFSTPPSSSRRAMYSDRFIPSRTTTNLEEAFDILGNKLNQKELLSKTDAPPESQLLMNNLLRTELLGEPAMDINVEMRMEGTLNSPNKRKESGGTANLFKYRLSQGSTTTMDSHMSSGSGYDSPASFGASPRKSSVGSPGVKPTRKIPKNPFKVLDAPALQDDYYLNLVDWSHNNVLSVALSSSVYLWSACTSKVSKLCDFGTSDVVTSVSWALTGIITFPLFFCIVYSNCFLFFLFYFSFPFLFYSSKGITSLWE